MIAVMVFPHPAISQKPSGPTGIEIIERKLSISPPRTIRGSTRAMPTDIQLTSAASRRK
jgi:hypothetical protein